MRRQSQDRRGRLTNDMLFMMQVLDELPELRLTGDQRAPTGKGGLLRHRHR
ncbi:MAG TPA: hypothetical protein VFW13_15790 [Phenylobacterium sp.]|nr:hypothetical protein [Phenylobacterium sp.]